jgi:hypothetical protein
MFERVSGSWKEITSPSENVSGTWKNITGGWENVSGTWKRFYQRLTVDSRDVETLEAMPGNSDANISWNTDGSWTRKGNISGTAAFDWLIDGSASGAEIRFTLSTGDAPVGAPMDTWLNMGSADRKLEVFQTSLGDKTATGTYSIRTTSGFVVGSGSWSITANRFM